MTSKRACAATTKKGTPCKAAPLDGRDVCLAHADEEVRESVGFGGSQPGAGRPPTPRTVDIIRERLESEADAWFTVLDEARQATRTVMVGHGENAFTETVPDHATRLAAFREAHDRAYGRPKQAQEISGPDGAPLDLSGAATDELRALAEQLRARRAQP